MKINRLELELRLVGDGPSSKLLLPIIDGRSLVDLVGEYEAAQGYDPAGAYGPLSFWQQKDFYGDGFCFCAKPNQHIWTLHCDCGESGCWPLEATVTVTEGSITWSDFFQPYRFGKSREVWDYSGFGPFVFDREEYDSVVAKASEIWG